jgi:chromosome segregation ATPase
MGFRSLVLAKYEIIAIGDMAGIDYPPKQLSDSIKNLKTMGREDLSKKLMDYWNSFLDKYPQYKGKHFGKVQTHFGNSIKKHLFEGKTYEQWLAGQQEEMSPVQQKQAQEAAKIVHPKNAPSIAIPHKDETVEDYSAAQAQTRKQIQAAKNEFATIFEYITQVEKEAADIQRKIETWGKAVTKSGEPDARSKRIPKWKAELEVYAEQLALIKEEASKTEKTFDGAVKKYEETHVGSVKYEEKVQETLTDLTNVLDYIMEVKDLKKQKALLEKFNATLEKQKKIGASFLVEADISDKISDFISKLKAGFKALKSWFGKLNKAVDKFDELASISYK